LRITYARINPEKLKNQTKRIIFAVLVEEVTATGLFHAILTPLE
jgi:hypothetical protein